MSERNKLRKTLREHYDAQEVPYNEQDWQVASSLLEAERNKNKRRVAAYVLAAFLGLSFLGLSVYKNFKDNSEKRILSYNKPVSETNQSPAENQVSSKSEQKTSSASNKTNSNPKKENGYSAKQLTQTKLNERNSPKEITPGKTKEPEAVSAASAPFPSENGSDEISSDSNGFDAGNNSVSGSIGNLNTGKTYEKNPTQAHKVLLDSARSDLAMDNMNKLTVYDQKTTAEFLPMIYSKLIVENQTELSLKGKTGFIDADKSVENPDTAASPSLLVSQQLTEEGIYYEVGAAWLYGWKNNTGRDARGFSPTAGINYMNRIADRFALSFGVHYIQVRNLSASSKTSKESIYKYGEQSKVTTIAPSTLHYLLAPLRLNYFMNERNSLGVGINLAYLLNVEARINTYDEKPGSTENQKSYKQSGYTEGISWYDSQAALFYTRKINKSFAVKTEIFFGLTDIKQNDFFGLNYRERNSGVKFTLLYYAFNKKNRQ